MKYLSSILPSAILLATGACGQVQKESTKETTDMEIRKLPALTNRPNNSQVFVKH